MSERRRTEQGFVLHSLPYRETSLIVELFTRESGRIPVIAKGARRPRSALRAVLLAFQPIDFALAGRGELKILAQAEWRGGLGMPQGEALLYGFYLNELIVRLLAREDPHPTLFDGYVTALGELASAGAHEAVLRRFEWLLLQEIGYAPDLACDAQGESIEAGAAYRIVSGQWTRTGGGERDAFAGTVLRDIAARRYDVPGVLTQAKRLNRMVLGEQLDGVPLKTRQMLLDLQRLDRDRRSGARGDPRN
ncbi:MAG: DNA repair protein RecO [Lautropia sp.]